MNNLTPEQEIQELINMYSDFHKDAYGFRPTYDYSNYTLEQLREDFEFFQSLVEAEEIRRQYREKEGVEIFTKLVKEIMEMCSCDKDRAVVYLMDAEQTDDWSYFCFLNNLPYNYKI